MVDLGQQSNDGKDDEETFHERHSTEQVLEEGERRLGAINSKQPKCICDKDKATNKRERERKNMHYKLNGKREKIHRKRQGERQRNGDQGGP